jgi:hypothetical protein
MILVRTFKAVLLIGFTSTLMWADAISGNLFYTVFGGSNRVFEVHFDFNGTTSFTLGPSTPLLPGGHIPLLKGADGLMFAPDGNLLIGEQSNNLAEITTSGAFVTNVKPGSNAFALALGSTAKDGIVYSLCNGGCGNHAISAVKLSGGGLSSNGVAYKVSGSDLDIRGLAFDPVNNTWYYGAAGDGAFGDFGTVVFNDVTHTAVTHVLLKGVPAHDLWFDPFTQDIMMNGKNSIAQFDPTTGKIVSTLTGRGPFDNLATDGHGELFAASNSGGLEFVDYDKSGLIGAAGNFSTEPFLSAKLDDIALSPTPTVPEPGSIVLLGTVFLGMALGAKKVNRRPAAR